MNLPNFCPAGLKAPVMPDRRFPFIRVLKNSASGRDPAMCGFGKCSPIFE